MDNMLAVHDILIVLHPVLGSLPVFLLSYSRFQIFSFRKHQESVEQLSSLLSLSICFRLATYIARKANSSQQLNKLVLNILRTSSGIGTRVSFTKASSSNLSKHS